MDKKCLVLSCKVVSVGMNSWLVSDSSREDTAETVSMSDCTVSLSLMVSLQSTGS